MIVMKKYILIVFMGLIVSLNVTAANTSQMAKETLDILKKLKTVSPENYLDYSDLARSKLRDYIKHKKLICSGEFSEVVIEDKQITSLDKKITLGPDEKKICFRELKSFQMTLINNLFHARKRYLSYLLEQQIELIKKTRHHSIQELNKTFARYLK